MIKIAIFGVGLIGGSLALCFKGKPDLYVIGHSPNQKSVDKYLERGVVDEATTSLVEAAEQADFLFICVPVGQLNDYLRQLSQCRLKSGAIISDVGSTKSEVVIAAKKYDFHDAVFIGGHPMAGKERSGVEAATSKLFANAHYVLTPTADTLHSDYDKLVALLSHTQATIIKLDAELHDEIVGAVSHLPHIVAAMLVNLVAEKNATNDNYVKLAAGGFRDTTRIASGDAALWRDISVSNRQVLIPLLQQWIDATQQVIEHLHTNDQEQIAHLFQTASVFRNSLPERRVGIASTHFEFYVEVPDQPGTIGRLTTWLGEEQINLRNIGILEKTAGGPGSLRLSFENQQDMERAKNFLESKGSKVHF
jgi:prephenate dehydrogenase